MNFFKFKKKTILERDISGKCDGCRDRIREGEESRQAFIDQSPVDYMEHSESICDAYLRNEPPGVWGGHI